MYRHVSVFTLKNKDEVDLLVQLLKEIDSCELIINNYIGTNITSTIEGKGPDFGDVIQMIDFKSLNDLEMYPTCKEHLKLLHDGPEMIKVTAIDYKI